MHGKSQSERQAESALKYRTKSLERFRARVTVETDDFLQPVIKLTVKAKKQLSTTTRIKAQTTEEAVIKKQLSTLKKEIELEAIQENRYFCCGCGTSYPGLDKSHILSVGQFKKYELLKPNIQLMCRNCHVLWESGEIQEKIRLHCFVENMLFIVKYEPVVYNKLITKIEEYQVFLVDQNEKQFVKEILLKL